MAIKLVSFFVFLGVAIRVAGSLRACKGRGTCPTGLECSQRRCTAPLYNGSGYTRISEIQGPGQVSPLVGKNVTTIGVVTAINRGTSYFIQDLYGDGNDLTSEAIYVFRTKFNGAAAKVGDVVEFTGTVTEYVPRSRPKDLPITELLSATGTVIKRGAGIAVPPVPAFSPPSPLSTFGSYVQNPKAKRRDIVDINYVCASAKESAICYYEAHEHMVVRVRRPRTVTAELRFDEIGIVSCKFHRRTSATVSKFDFRPETITVEDDLFAKPAMRDLGVGQNLFDVTGVVFYSFSQFKLYNTVPLLPRGRIIKKEPKACRATGTRKSVSISAWNVENRDPKDPKSEFVAIGSSIANLQNCPDVIALSEIGDNDGSTSSNVTDADQTLKLIADEATKACGTEYLFTDIDPLNRADGGLPGENIRVAFMYRSDRIRLVDRGGPGNAVDGVSYDSRRGGLSANPGRVKPSAFGHSRKPLAGEFKLKLSGARFIVVVNHWNSKRGDDRLFGRIQPPLQGSQPERQVQADAVRQFVRSIPYRIPVFVVGDLNDFHFSKPVKSLGLRNLWFNTKPKNRYSFVFQSRFQTLDHILVRGRRRCRFCPIHSTTLSSYGSPLRPTDHDPLVTVCRI